MGCDIHLHFEKKNDQGKWEMIEVPYCLLPKDRDYSVFYFLAGVRYASDCVCEPQFPLRGLPEDSCALSNDDFFSDHSTTYAYIDEILHAPWEKVGLHCRYFYVFCEYVLPRLINEWGYWGALDKREVRVIMGFDS